MAEERKYNSFEYDATVTVNIESRGGGKTFEREFSVKYNAGREVVDVNKLIRKVLKKTISSPKEVGNQ